MNNIEVRVGDIFNEEDSSAMLTMLNVYMNDPMGGSQNLQEELAKKNVEGLREQSNYVFFLAYYRGELAGVANCFVNFSTFKGKQLINIHDFSVSPNFRRKGIGEAMMNRIVEYCNENDFCKITLEVRYDNPGAQHLYKKMGFDSGIPPYHFWEKKV